MIEVVKKYMIEVVKKYMLNKEVMESMILYIR